MFASVPQSPAGWSVNATTIRHDRDVLLRYSVPMGMRAGEASATAVVERSSVRHQRASTDIFKSHLRTKRLHRSPVRGAADERRTPLAGSPWDFPVLRRTCAYRRGKDIAGAWLSFCSAKYSLLCLCPDKLSYRGQRDCEAVHGHHAGLRDADGNRYASARSGVATGATLACH